VHGRATADAMRAARYAAAVELEPVQRCILNALKHTGTTIGAWISWQRHLCCVLRGGASDEITCLSL
jgi:hypothetical protein